MSENEERAARAAIALEAYKNIPGTDPDAAVRDLLSDLMHYCDQNELLFKFELEVARSNYIEEAGELD
jgi:hypothetical protein